MHEDILNAKLKIPKGASSKCKDLLKKLLEKNPYKRLGCGKNGVAEIKNHPFFKNINWRDVYNKKLPLPGVEKFEIKSKKIHPSEVFGDYEDFEADSNIGSWSFCKTIHEIDNSNIY